MFHEFGKPVVVTLWHSHMQVQEWQILRKYEVGRLPQASLHWRLVSWSKPAEHSYNPYTIYAKDLQVVCKSSVNTPPVYANLDHGLLSDQPKRWSGSVSVKIWDEKF